MTLLVPDMKIRTFQARIDLYVGDIESGALLHFSRLREVKEHWHEKEECKSFLLKLKEKFESRFSNFKQYDELFVTCMTLSLLIMTIG